MENTQIKKKEDVKTLKDYQKVLSEIISANQDALSIIKGNSRNKLMLALQRQNDALEKRRSQEFKKLEDKFQEFLFRFQNKAIEENNIDIDPEIFLYNECNDAGTALRKVNKILKYLENENSLVA